jgi:uncharacterized protein YndB with AHSA1/START domain
MKNYTGHLFTFTRQIPARRALVCKAWTNPKQLARWWGPHGFTNPVCQWDARPGRPIHVVMRAPSGSEHPMGGEFREVVAPRRLVITCGVPGQSGKMLFEFLHSVNFAERQGKTVLTVKSRVLHTTAEANKFIGGFEEGMSQSLERLAALLVAPLTIEQTFRAPAARVWKALTDKDEMSKWSFGIKKFRPEVGFAFEFYGEKDGVKFLHQCRVTEVILRKRLAYTWRYVGHPGRSLVTVELSAAGRKTKLRLTHDGLETFPQNKDFARANFQVGWTALIGTHLKNHVEPKPRRK